MVEFVAMRLAAAEKKNAKKNVDSFRLIEGKDRKVV